MNNRKTIGILLAQPEENYQNQFLQGVTEQAFAHDYDCIVFAVEYKDVKDNTSIIGSDNIFELVNFDLLDAVIIVPDTIKNKPTLERLIERIKSEFNGVVVSADTKIEGFENIDTDDSDAIEKICDHLIDDHGAKIIDFMGGIPGHPHSIRRQEGYVRALKKHGIEIECKRIHDGDFWYNKGEPIADEILNSSLPFPDAVVCASDSMAISLCDAFSKRGIKTPNNILITGYDSIEEGRLHNPAITSSSLPSKITGIKCVNYILKKLEGKPIISDFDKETIIKSQSCGCEQENITYHSNNSAYTDSNYRTPFQGYSDIMMSSLISVNDMDDMLANINWYTYMMQPFSSYILCLTDDWVGAGDNEDDYRRNGYSDKIHLRLIRRDENNGNVEDIVFDKHELLPRKYFECQLPSIYFFYPLHFLDRCFGYTVMVYENKTTTPTPDYRPWTHFVSNGLECLRRRLHIRKMYDKLKSIADLDSLTGLYNRNTFNSNVEAIAKRTKNESFNALFLMADLNYLKTINDTFGHLAGDIALRAVAKAVQSVCDENDRSYRFGGDEFMIIADGTRGDERIKEMKEGIEHYLEKYNETSKDPFIVTASVGAVCTTITDAAMIDDVIRTADEIMYADKQHKKRRLINPLKKV